MVECGGRCSIETGVLGDCADHECRHGRLPFDRTLACGCWYEEGAVALALTRPVAEQLISHRALARFESSTRVPAAFRPHGSI
jgi:hypothetical protein